MRLNVLKHMTKLVTALLTCTEELSHSTQRATIRFTECRLLVSRLVFSNCTTYKTDNVSHDVYNRIMQSFLMFFCNVRPSHFCWRHLLVQCLGVSQFTYCKPSCFIFPVFFILYMKLWISQINKYMNSLLTAVLEDASEDVSV